MIQPKLQIGQPGDRYEQEADRIADQVMRMPEPSVQRQVKSEAEEELQRQPIEEEEKKKEEEETLQTKPLAESITPLVQRQTEPTEEEEKKKEEEETLQTKTASDELPTVSSSLQNRIAALRGGGQPRASSSASKTPDHEQSSCQCFAAKSALGFAHDLTGIPVSAQSTSRTSVKSSAKLPGQSKALQPKPQPEVGVSFGLAGLTFGLGIEPDMPSGTKSPVGFGPFAPPQIPAVPAGTCPAGTAWVTGKHVTPNYVVDRPAAKRSNTDPSTTDAKDPTYAGEVVVDCPGKAWRHQIKTVESKGTIQIVYYDADHYPAPTPTDDSGALSNVTKANWKDITKDLDNNKTGIPDFWSAYKREILHEDYHWKTEWQGEVNKEMPKAEAEIEKLKVDFTAAATAADAEKTLKPGADKAFKDAMTRARAAYDALGDSPGDPPYVAQAPALEALSKRVKDHAAAQKW